MALTWSYAAHTEVGLVRTSNQDSAYASATMLMVADGMGGAAAGDLASAVAARELARTDENLDRLVAEAHAARQAHPAEHAASDEEPPPPLDDVLAVMEDALARANEQLVELVDDDPALTGMGTTVCGFVLREDHVGVVNIGDSRAYLIRDGQLHRVTRDHSWVQTLVDEGRITEAEALEHPHRSLVLRVLNGSTQHEPDLGWVDVRPGDRLLVCSDGLCGLATDAQIERVVTRGADREDTIDDLVALAHAAGGHDNITLIVADVEIDGPLGTPLLIGAAETTPIPTAEHTLSFAPIGDLPPDVAQERAITEAERYALQGRRRPGARVKMVLAFLLPLLVLLGAGAAWYQYTRTQYFVGTSDGQVALYRGVPDQLFGLPLATLVRADETKVSDLPPYYAERVRATIRVSDQTTAEATIAELREKAAQCVAQRAEHAQAETPPPTTPDTTAEPASPTSVAPDAPTTVGVTAPAEPQSPEDC